MVKNSGGRGKVEGVNAKQIMFFFPFHNILHPLEYLNKKPFSGMCVYFPYP